MYPTLESFQSCFRADADRPLRLLAWPVAVLPPMLHPQPWCYSVARGRGTATVDPLLTLVSHHGMLAMVNDDQTQRDASSPVGELTRRFYPLLNAEQQGVQEPLHRFFL